MQQSTNADFIRTTAINKILKLKKRVKGIQGGSSAGKTYGTLPILIDYALKVPNTEISVVAESIPHLKRGALKDFKKIMIATQRWHQNEWHSTDSKYSFGNNSVMEFFSCDDASKLRGGRRHILYMNEANNISFEAYQELSIRTKKYIYLDWNPTAPFWFHEELANDDDVDFLIINYTDNEACPPDFIKEVEKAKAKAKTSSYWLNWYNVYGLGLLGSLEGVIYQNWKQIDTVPAEAKLISYGLDFGFTNDPTALVACYQYNGKLIFDELIYQKGLLNSDISQLIKSKGVISTTPIWADSAEPKSIAELRQRGIFAKEAIKGADSIKFGIDYLQQFELLITSRSTNTIKELRNYIWDKDKEGNQLNKPIDAFNHSMDAMRYSVCSLSMPQRRMYAV